VTHEVRHSVVVAMMSELEALRAKLDEKDQAPHEHDERHLAIEEHERLLEEMKRGYEEQLERAREAEQAREKILREMKLSADGLLEAFGAVDKMTPFLLNMSDDPTLAGCLLYYMLPGSTRTVGSGPENSIHLQGIGISHELCSITNRDNTFLSITKTGPEGRVVINGKPVDEGQPQQLRHGMRIYLGRASL